jgi:hypothetical protein
MILIKCTSDKCHYALTDEQIILLKKDQAKLPGKCPLCKSKLKKNISEPLARKKWHGYLSQDQSTVEHLVLVIMDDFNDGSILFSIPILDVQFWLNDKLQGMYQATEQIDRYLKNQYGSAYENERKFITVAFQGEIIPAKHNIPVGEVILQNSRKDPQVKTDGQSTSVEEILMPDAQ